jgi:hypothetical protein
MAKVVAYEVPPIPQPREIQIVLTLNRVEAESLMDLQRVLGGSSEGSFRGVMDDIGDVLYGLGVRCSGRFIEHKKEYGKPYQTNPHFVDYEVAPNKENK